MAGNGNLTIDGQVHIADRRAGSLSDLDVVADTPNPGQAVGGLDCVDDWCIFHTQKHSPWNSKSKGTSRKKIDKPWDLPVVLSPGAESGGVPG